MIDYLFLISKGLPVSIGLTIFSLIIAFFLALILTILLTLKKPLIHLIIRGYLNLFTGTPLLIQLFLIYYGPGQFDWITQSAIWPLLSNPWFCALLALALNSAAYTTQIFYGALCAIPQSQWQACQALGMKHSDTLRILLPYALKRTISSYSNEAILVFKSTSLVCTIAIADMMGIAQQLNGTRYDPIMIFSAAGIIYLVINGSLTILLRWLEKQALSFERL